MSSGKKVRFNIEQCEFSPTQALLLIGYDHEIPFSHGQLVLF